MDDNEDEGRTATSERYEFRVWGPWEDAARRLVDLADSSRVQRIDDCYLLVPDPGLNVKVRDGRLKIKRLLEQRVGFQLWSKQWFPMATDVSVGYPPTLGIIAVPGQTPTDGGIGFPVVNVSKRRRRFRVGALRAETADLDGPDLSAPLHTLAIEGPHLDQLVALRSALGLDRAPNIASHVAVEARC